MEECLGEFFNNVIGMKLGAVISGNLSNPSLVFSDQFDDASIEFNAGACFEFSDDGVNGLSLNECDDAMLIVGCDDRINLPVHDAGPIFGTQGPFGDIPFAG